MQLALNQLPGHLAQGLRPLYTLHGDEPLQLQEAADAIRAAARAAGFTERSVFTVQGAHFDWSAVLAAGSALSLFADKQIIELRIPSGKPGGKEGAAALAQLAQQAAQAQEVLTLVHLPRLDAASKKTAWFTALDAHGIHIPIQPIEREQLPSWIAQRLQAQGQQVAHNAQLPHGLPEAASVAKRENKPAAPEVQLAKAEVQQRGSAQPLASASSAMNARPVRVSTRITPPAKQESDLAHSDSVRAEQHIRNTLTPQAAPHDKQHAVSVASGVHMVAQEQPAADAGNSSIQ